MSYNIYDNMDDEIKIYEEILEDYSKTTRWKASLIRWTCFSILKLMEKEHKSPEFLTNGLILILELYHNYDYYISERENANANDLLHANRKILISALKQEIC